MFSEKSPLGDHPYPYADRLERRPLVSINQKTKMSLLNKFLGMLLVYHCTNLLNILSVYRWNKQICTKFQYSWKNSDWKLELSLAQLRLCMIFGFDKAI